MSYILDALKKSQAERDQGLGPAFLSEPSRAAAEPRRSYAGLATAAGALLVALGVAIGVWQPWRSAEPPADVPAGPVRPAAEPPLALAPPAEQAPPAVPVADAAAQPDRADSDAPQAEAAAPARATPAEARPAPRAGPAKSEKPARAAPARAARGEAAGRPPAPKAEQAAAALTPAPKPERTAPAPKPEQTVSAAASATEAPPPGVVAYRELPRSIRDALPKLSFSGFAGTEDASVRIAFVNDRLVQEGEEVSPGVRLERVDSSGMVLNYKGYRFRAESR